MLQTITVDRTHPYPPRFSGFTRTFWDGLREGRLLSTRSVVSQQWTFPPKPHSPHAWEEPVEWSELSGRGVLYAHTTIHAAPAAFAADVPYRICLIDLDEGVRVAARFVGEAEPRVGEPARMVVLSYRDCATFAATQDPPNS